MPELKKEKIDKVLYAIGGAYLGYFVIHPTIMLISFTVMPGEFNPLLALVTAFSFRMVPWALSFTLLGVLLGYLYGSMKENMAQLEYSTRVKELFIDILHHDLASPLSRAKMNIELYLKNRREGYLETSLESIDEMWGIIEDSRNLAKLESGKISFEELDLAAVIEEVVEEYHAFAGEKEVEIREDFGKPLPLRASRTIKMAVGNLLSNAIKYSPRGSTVTLSLEEEGGSYVLAIADLGEGVPEEKREIIFERFERAEKKGIKGTGLGLAIVKRIADMHGGKVWVEANQPRGSTFKLEIPLG